MSCAQARERLAEALLDGRPLPEAERQHAARCSACGEELRFLEALRGALDASPLQPLSAEARARCLDRARRELRTRQIPRDFGHVLARVLAAALALLPLVGLQAWLGVRAISGGLGGWLPEPAVLWLEATYLSSLGLLVAIVFVSLPVIVSLAGRGREELA